MYLYHATFVSNLASIKKYGLGAKQPKNWDISVDGVVCFAKDPDEAFSFCESADEVSDTKYNSGIVVLRVDSRLLMKSKARAAEVKTDRNNKSNTTLEYSGIINPYIIDLVTEDGEVYKLMELKRYPRYEG